MSAQVSPPVIDTIPPEIPRDRYGRPYVIDPKGKRTAYTRCTTFVSVLEDTWNLSKWSQRNVAVGLSQRPDLLLAVSAHRDDKQKLNALCEQASEAAASKAGATTGTALHALTEKVDRGIDIGPVPDSVIPDLDAYLEATKYMDHQHIEAFCVLDILKVGGTPDRVTEWNGPTGLLEKGKRYISDLKTGSSLDFGVAKMSMQLAIYARSSLYDISDAYRPGQRTDHGAELDVGIIVWLPAGKGVCEVYVIDLREGWRGVLMARAVREWRSTDKKATFLTPVHAGDPIEAVDPVLAAIYCAPDTATLGRVWTEHKHCWIDVYTSAAKARKAELEKGWHGDASRPGRRPRQ